MKRPFLETIALWLVLMLSAWNALKAWTALAWRDVLLEYSVRMPPALSAILGGVWCILGVVLAWGVWRRKAWTVKWLPAAAVFYTAWYWSERLVWQNPRPNAAFAVIANLACLILIVVATKTLSREAYERNTENPAIE